ncbi:unnamed protein product [Vitrella brassicaformis CCMP3155]|uniref:Uncharacterized protein n=2 Tax=Vitrella brassicaformis TaxID=1169539 RepID=A0A0G4GLI7_VITBC|nr:unnamed protein product [Vitrella brassicaformis CCMP3155]|eukprot:CEM31002.1 unnamed protein product [Vitrella brassicaformis CCMP3155]
MTLREWSMLLLRPKKLAARADRGKMKKQYYNMRHKHGYYYNWLGQNPDCIGRYHAPRGGPGGPIFRGPRHSKFK